MNSQIGYLNQFSVDNELKPYESKLKHMFYSFFFDLTHVLFIQSEIVKMTKKRKKRVKL